MFVTINPWNLPTCTGCAQLLSCQSFIFPITLFFLSWDLSTPNAKSYSWDFSISWSCVQKKPKRCLLSRGGNPSLKLLTPSLCHFLSPEIGFCMRKVSVISIASMPPCFSIYAGTCLYLMGKLGRQVGFVYRQGCCPLVQAAFVRLVSTLDSWGQYCFWQTLGSSWHRTCWKQELVITINPLLQSFVFKPFKLSCNLHSNIPHCWWTFRNETFSSPCSQALSLF